MGGEEWREEEWREEGWGEEWREEGWGEGWGWRRGGGGGVQVGNLYYTTAVQYQAMKAEVALARSPYMEIDLRRYKEKHGFL